jgi:Exocyst complex component EXOC6/Sec15, N-terminal
VDELLDMRTEVEELRLRIQRVDALLQRSGCTVLQPAQRVCVLSRTLRNVYAAQEMLSSARAVLRLTAQLKTHMRRGEYYHVLRGLELLEFSYLPRLQETAFGAHIALRVPVARELVRRRVIDMLNDWLVEVRERAEGVGMLLMRGTAGNESEQQQQRSEEESSEEDDPLARLAVDFTPLHRCLHVYDTLDMRQELRQYYTHNRRLQLMHCIQYPVLEEQESARQLEGDATNRKKSAEGEKERAQQRQHELTQRLRHTERRRSAASGVGVGVGVSMGVGVGVGMRSPSEKRTKTVLPEERHLAKIAGFFVCESHVLHTVSGIPLAGETVVESWWAQVMLCVRVWHSYSLPAALCCLYVLSRACVLIWCALPLVRTPLFLLLLL